MASNNLKSKAISGTIWSGVHRFGMVLLNFISGIVLARLLTPHDYGVIGMLTIFLAVCNTFIDGGFGSALIQKKNPTDVDYSTILFWNLGLSLLLYFVLFVCAPFIAKFYNMPLLSIVLRVQGLVLIFNAARIVQRSQLRKELLFKKVAIINVSSNIIALLVTIILAIKGWGVWALVAQQLLLALLTSLLYWIFSKWKPVMFFSVRSFKELFSFGGFILLSNLFNTICNNLEGLLIGKVYNSSTLGYYTKARRTEMISSTFISGLLNQVVYPVFSEVQNDKSRLISVLRKFITTSAFITFPLMLLLLLLAKPLFVLLYSERWLDSVPYFQLLCLGGIAICLQDINYYAVAAIGKSKEMLRWTIVKRLFGISMLIVGLWLYGIYGVVIGMTVSSWFVYFVNGGMSSKYVGYKFSQQFMDLAPILMLSVVAFLLSWSVSLINIDNIYNDALIKLVVFITSYWLISVLMKLDTYKSAKETISYIVKTIKNRI